MSTNTGRCVCGSQWVQRGSQTGHCAACHLTFDSERAFERHRTTRDDKRICLAAHSVVREDGTPALSQRTGVGRSDTGVIYWRESLTRPSRARSPV